MVAPSPDWSAGSRYVHDCAINERHARTENAAATIQPPFAAGLCARRSENYGFVAGSLAIPAIIHSPYDSRAINSSRGLSGRLRIYQCDLGRPRVRHSRFRKMVLGFEVRIPPRLVPRMTGEMQPLIMMAPGMPDCGGLMSADANGGAAKPSLEYCGAGGEPKLVGIGLPNPRLVCIPRVEQRSNHKVCNPA